MGVLAFKWYVEKEDFLVEIEYFSNLIFFGRYVYLFFCVRFLRFMSSLFCFLESVWFYLCRKFILWVIFFFENLGSCRKRFFIYILSFLGSRVIFSLVFLSLVGKVKLFCIVKFLSVRFLNVIGEIMKERYFIGLDKFSGF